MSSDYEEEGAGSPVPRAPRKRKHGASAVLLPCLDLRLIYLFAHYYIFQAARRQQHI